MLAAIFHGDKKIEVCDHTLPTLGFNELLIKVDSCGICGTDKHIFSGSAPSSIPIILGHEYSGTIVDLVNLFLLNLRLGIKLRSILISIAVIAIIVERVISIFVKI